MDISELCKEKFNFSLHIYINFTNSQIKILLKKIN